MPVSAEARAAAQAGAQLRDADVACFAFALEDEDARLADGFFVHPERNFKDGDVEYTPAQLQSLAFKRPVDDFVVGAFARLLNARKPDVLMLEPVQVREALAGRATTIDLRLKRHLFFPF